VVASFGYEKYLSIEGSKDILGFTLKYREDPIILDPRNKNLGARLIINLEKLYLSLKKLELKDDKIKNYYNQSHKLGIVPKNLNKLKNKLSKRLLPIELIQGKLIEDETIFNNDIEIGKVLINDDYPFALIKYLDKNFDKNDTFVSKNGTFKILVPTWLNI